MAAALCDLMDWDISLLWLQLCVAFQIFHRISDI
jgi:hypothetical protein